MDGLTAVTALTSERRNGQVFRLRRGIDGPKGEVNELIRLIVHAKPQPNKLVEYAEFTNPMMGGHGKGEKIEIKGIKERPGEQIKLKLRVTAERYIGLVL